MKILTSTIVLGLMLAGCDSSYQNSDYNTSETTNSSTQESSANSSTASSEITDTQTTPSNINTQSYTKASQISTHNQGESCLRCHNSSYYNTFGAPSYTFRDDGENENENESNENEDAEDDESFTSGATLYGTLHGNNSALTQSYSLRLVLESTNEIANYYAGRGTSNFALFYPNNINNYTVEVVDASGRVVNSSQKNSHDMRRLDCNKCHTSSGLNGAPGRISVTTNSTTTSTPTAETTTPTTQTPIPSSAKSFANDVMPILESKCKNCHGNNGRFKVTSTSNTLKNLQSNSLINSSSPDDSKLLRKARDRFFLHGGGEVLSQTSTQYKTIAQWMREGAQNN